MIDADLAGLAVDLDLGDRGVVGAAAQGGRDAAAARDA